MKLVGVTQRVDNIEHYFERRDCLDQRWSDFFNRLGYLVIPLPNIAKERVSKLCDKLQLDAILLSGGNSIAELNPSAKDSAPERDEFEKEIVNYAIQNNIPLVGVCRGMQLLNIHLGGSLCALDGHIATRHAIESPENNQLFNRIVNSYHAWGIRPQDLALSLNPLAYDDKGNVEAFYSTSEKQLGLMWHPEREEQFNQFDIQIISEFLK
ncbi:peptidase C26 [Shewanella pealeana ATCC 700345]|uniref:Peptidase C26 n=1 Tax=Shewanella pealeana (strain ATCC 700345 / ANG-SQ1) TaxID=398579 RepID=A8H2E4_SHEPA|nr:gamma-glutamyl-gamma-aminobutyrate hydrolase family protein [Shewanella pealeana]ABV86731.1 peptidase C26 [Shewanella pealeana ATCC 700345]